MREEGEKTREELRTKTHCGVAQISAAREGEKNTVLTVGGLTRARRRQKWVAGGWIVGESGASDNNRRARYYSITPTGRKQMAQEEENWAQLTEAVTRVLRLV